jgi:hypothetical protein
MTSWWGKQQNKTQLKTKTPTKQHWLAKSKWSRRRRLMYTTRSHQKTSLHQENHQKLLGSTNRKLEEKKSHHVSARDEHLLAREHHAPVYGQLGKTRMVATEVEDD